MADEFVEHCPFCGHVPEVTYLGREDYVFDRILIVICLKHL